MKLVLVLSFRFSRTVSDQMLLQGGFEFALPCRAIRGRLHPGADFLPLPASAGMGGGAWGVKSYRRE